MTDTALQSGAATSFSSRDRFAYGLGGMPVGLIQNGIAFFLLIYYNQVIGMDPALAASALALALIADAISDPLVGYLSDNWKSKSGRRHPFLYLAAIPTAIFFYLIWNPPAGAGDMALFWYLLGTVVGLRTSMTVFDVPHNAMIADLSRDYYERTRLANYKIGLVQFAGYVMVIAMYAIWLTPTEADPSGILNEAGYKSAGNVAAVLIAVTMLLAALATRDKIPLLSRTSHDAKIGLGELFRQLANTLSIPSLRILLVSGIVSAVASGLFLALWAYIMGFFWELGPDQTSLILFANFAGALLAVFTANFYLTKGEKKRRVIELSILAILVSAAPYLLRFAGLFPGNGTDMLFYLLFLHGIVQVLVFVWLSIVVASMTADVVEAGIASGGYQNEGIVLAATTFIQKFGTAGGLIGAGVVLALAEFPESADPTQMPAEAPTNLAWLFVVIVSMLYAISTLIITRYRISKADFEQMVSEIG